MDMLSAIEALAALAQSSRLAVFRLLVRAGPHGAPAGELAREVGALPNTLSTHLGVLERAGLIRSTRRGRSIIYAADYDRMRNLLGFLMEDCCGGQAEICAPLAEIINRAACCATDQTVRQGEPA